MFELRPYDTQFLQMCQILVTYLTFGLTPFGSELSQMVPNARPEQIENVLQLWPSDPKLGSPFGTGDKNAVTPVYKQYAAILGDFGFQVRMKVFLWTDIDLIENSTQLNSSY